MQRTIAVLTLLVATGCLDDGPHPVPPPPVPTPDQCPEGFAPLGTLAGCYLKLTPRLAWVEAEEACEQHAASGVRAHLIVIDREEEHAAISALARNGDLWIGRLQEDPDGDYKNINYIAWDPEYFGSGEPNDYEDTDERCVEYKYETGLWNDEKCWRVDRVICEWDNVEPYDWRPHRDE